MFEKGETVYYGTAGVCKVSDICRSPFDKKDDRMFSGKIWGAVQICCKRNKTAIF